MSAPSPVHVELLPRHLALAERLTDLARREIAPREHEESDEFAREITARLGDEGLLDPGVELDVRGICVAREIVARHSGLVDSMLALQGLGYGPIALAGSPELRAAYGPGVRSGRAIAAFALTEAEAGSDVGAIATTARRDGDEWVLDGRKCFITNAPIADVFTVFARTGGPGAKGVSAFVVPGDRVRRGPRYRPIAAHPLGEIVLEGARVPADHLLGQEGQGISIALSTLDHFRPTVGAAALGLADRALSESVERAKRRRQFGKAIVEFQQIAAMLADSKTELEAARLLVYRAAYAKDVGAADAGPLAAMAKLFATESAQRIIDRAVQIHGGAGVLVGSIVERLYREVRALRIYEGTSEIQRLVISRALTR